MKISQYYNAAFEETKKNLDDFTFKCCYRVNPKHFSRERKIGFKQTILFMMNMAKRSIQLELNSFMETILKKSCSISKQAYAKARQNINPEVFRDLSNSMINGLYNKCDDYKLWNGYRLSALDGSILELPNTALLREKLGYSKNQYTRLARARASCIYDVLNKLIIKSLIYRYDISEPVAAKEILSQFVADGVKNDIILFDRAYPSAELMAYLTDNKIKFVMRAQKNFSNEVKKAKDKDQIVTIKHNKKHYDVRILRFPLESGEEEILLTSLFDEELTIKDFKALYFMRWGIETKYADLKNRIQVENFTGTTKISIEQDFYATIYLSNMAELLRIQNDECLKESSKNLKYEYKTNTNILIGTLKDSLVLMLLENSPERRNKMFQRIMSQIAQNRVPIRPGRHNKRNDNLVHSKHRLNQKRCL